VKDNAEECRRVQRSARGCMHKGEGEGGTCGLVCRQAAWGASYGEVLQEVRDMGEGL
jgi:hypothetical protein